MVNSYKTAILFEISLASIEDDIGGISKIALDIENCCAQVVLVWSASPKGKNVYWRNPI